MKQLGRVVGVEVHAVTIALSAFFAGLALGGALLGRLADRTPRPIRLYAILEAGVAVLGVLATLALARSGGPFVSLRETVGPLAWALPFALVGLPSFLMGGTLPALLRALRPGDAAVAPATGLLYAANTAGAVAGTLATPFVLVPAFGITGTGFFAATVGLGVAAAALALDRRTAATSPTAASESAAPARSRDARLALALYAVAGGVALGYEVVWSRAPRAVPQHPDLRLRRDAGDLPDRPRPRQLPLHALRPAGPRPVAGLRPAPGRRGGERDPDRGRPRSLAPRRPDVRGHVGDASHRPGDGRGRGPLRSGVARDPARAHDTPRRRVPGGGAAGRRGRPGRAATSAWSPPSTRPAASRGRS